GRLTDRRQPVTSAGARRFVIRNNRLVTPLFHAMSSAMYEVGHASETIGDSLYRTIRTDIVVGRLPAAQKLKLEQLKIRYGASISTLREILNRLTSDGLVVAEGQRGFVVAPMSPADLREVAALRQLLECQALELSLGAGDIDWEA